MTSIDTTTHTALTWQRGDAYHVPSACGRYSVARMRVMGSMVLVAFWTPKGRHAEELAERRLGTDPTDEQKATALAELKAECEVHSTSVFV